MKFSVDVFLGASPSLPRGLFWELMVVWGGEGGHLFSLGKRSSLIKIPACHAGVPGSIPGEGASFFAIFFLVECSLSFVLSFGVGFVGIAHLVAEIWPFQNCTSFFFWDGRRGGGEGG